MVRPAKANEEEIKRVINDINRVCGESVTDGKVCYDELIDDRVTDGEVTDGKVTDGNVRNERVMNWQSHRLTWSLRTDP